MRLGRLFVSPPSYHRFTQEGKVRSNVTDIDVQIHHEVEKAVKVSVDGIEAHAQWLPKSRIEIDFDGATLSQKKGLARITLPIQMAKEKGLI